MIGLCDCNNFFVSCERVFNPSLRGKAVIVLSNNDGCVIARSNEAKALGIKMAQPLFQIKELVKRCDVKIFSSNYPLYGDMSQRVMSTLRDSVPSIEVYSVDEAFLDFEGFSIDELQERGRELSRRVERCTGIPVSIGIAPTKTLAKIASRLCKRYPKLEGCCLMYREQDVAKVLSTLPVEDVWGIGRRSTKMLHESRVVTAADFCAKSVEWVQAKMGIVGVRTWRELHGESCIEIESRTHDRESIMVSRSFSHEIYSLDDLRERFSLFITQACEKLRVQHSVAAKLQVFMHSNRFREDLEQHHPVEDIAFERATDSTLEFASAALGAASRLFRQGVGYKRAGVVLRDITPKDGVQSALFDNIDRAKHDALMQTIDRLNGEMKRQIITLGSQGHAEVISNSEYRSAQYTTCWDDIIKVKV